jgi:maltose O-acetyltransferase
MSKPPQLWKRALLRVDRWLQKLRTDALVRRFAACGRDVSIQWPVVINGADHLRVGNGVSINAFVHIWAQGGVSIGDSSLIASHVAITSLTHGTDAETFGGSLVSKPVEIGRNVWIGSHAVVLPGVTIGDGAIVGAGAVVTRNVEAGDRVAGVPAVSIRSESH